MLKGTTKIELKDARTGAVTETEDHNVVTAALNKVLKSYGAFNNSIFNITDAETRIMPHWKNILGGILLFEDEIPYVQNEGQDGGYTETCWPPASAKMVANGSALFYSVYQKPKEIGIFNESESGIQADGSIKFVYDWDTAHGNGTIRCVCLTSCAGGYEGYGNWSGEVETEYSSVSSYKYINGQNTQPQNDIIADSFEVVKTDIETGAVYFIDGNELKNTAKFFKKTGRLHIYRARGMTSFLKLAAATNNIPYELYKTVTIPEESLSKYKDGAYETATDCKTGRTYISTGQSRYILVLDGDFNLIEKDLENSFYYPVSIAYNNRLYINGDIYRSAMVLDADSNGVVHEFEKGTIKEFNGILCDGFIQAAYTDNRRQEVLVETDTFQHTRTNRKTTYEQKFYIENGLGFIHQWSDSNYKREYLDLFKEGRYLATINNLSSPVTKTAEKTMKITYTIREE